MIGIMKVLSELMLESINAFGNDTLGLYFGVFSVSAASCGSSAGTPAEAGGIGSVTNEFLITRRTK